MFLSKVKLVMKAFAIVAALAAGAVALAQSGISKPKDGTDKSQHVGSPSWTYHILVSRDGEPPRKVAVVEMTGDAPIRVDAPGALILIQPKRDGEPDRQTTTDENYRNKRTFQATDKKTGREIVLTSPKAMDVVITQQYVCQIHSQRHISVRALASGHLNEIKVRDGQAVKKGDLMFNILPTANNAPLGAYATDVKAPFDGTIDRLYEQQGSLIKEGDVLTTLSDNSVMWAYFNVPENQYLEFMANRKQFERNRIELMLADQTKFPQPGLLQAIDAEFNNETGNIAFRADFPNPEGLLRHGQRGTILIHRNVHDAIVIPQQATFEIDDKRYVYVVGKDDVVHRRLIVIQHETDDNFVIKKGVGVNDRIVLEGIRQVRDGEKVKYEFRPLEELVRKRKVHSD